MLSQKVELTDELERFVNDKVRSGRFEDASEVVRAALRMLAREEQEDEVKIATLRAAIEEGDASGIAEGDVFQRVRQTLNLPRSPG
jgi:antitoxin ParD1/3/4